MKSFNEGWKLSCISAYYPALLSLSFYGKKRAGAYTCKMILGQMEAI